MRDHGSFLRYFAYGSNMSTRRMALRVASARALGRARLDGYRLAFHKRGVDGSGKCDAVYTGDVADVVHGVLYSIESARREELDRVEGLDVGYRREAVRVALADGRTVEAFTYVALLVEKGLRPYQWYLQHVIAGAREHGLPSTYRKKIRRALAVTDPDAGREARELAIYED